MSSNNNPLRKSETGETLRFVSDDADLRDAGEPVTTTSADPAGCRPDEAELDPDVQTQDSVAEIEPAGRRLDEGEQPAEPDGDSSVSVTAQGGSSENSSPEPQTPADAIKSHRDFEAFLRASGFSRAVSKAISKNGWQAVGEVETDTSSEDETIMAQQLIDLFKMPGSK